MVPHQVESGWRHESGQFSSNSAVPNVRKISMSPWVAVEFGAERIGKDFVFSRKPSPALLAVDDWDPEAVRKDLLETIEACERHGCPVEMNSQGYRFVMSRSACGSGRTSLASWWAQRMWPSPDG